MRQLRLLHLLTLRPKPRLVLHRPQREMARHELLRRIALRNIIRARLEAEHLRDRLVPALALREADQRLAAQRRLHDLVVELVLDVHQVCEEHSEERHAGRVGLGRRRGEQLPVTGESACWLVVLGEHVEVRFAPHVREREVQPRDHGACERVDECAEGGEVVEVFAFLCEDELQRFARKERRNGTHLCDLNPEIYRTRALPYVWSIQDAHLHPCNELVVGRTERRDVFKVHDIRRRLGVR